MSFFLSGVAGGGCFGKPFTLNVKPGCTTAATRACANFSSTKDLGEGDRALLAQQYGIQETKEREIQRSSPVAALSYGPADNRLMLTI